MIEREYSKLIENELKFKEISVLIGSRQVGKTTLMRELFDTIKEKSIYFVL